MYFRLVLEHRTSPDFVHRMEYFETFHAESIEAAKQKAAEILKKEREKYSPGRVRVQDFMMHIPL